jgi:hypothetical protein
MNDTPMIERSREWYDPRVARGWLAPVAALAVCWALAGVARAAAGNSGPTSGGSAKELYDGGRTNYNLGHFEEALADFEKAYRVRHDPVFLFNIAQCQRSLHRYEEAARSYRTYLREANNIPAATRDQVQKLAADMDKALEEQRLKQPPTGTQPPAPEPAATTATTTTSSAAAPVAPAPSPATTATAPLAVNAAPAPADKPRPRRTWIWGVVAGAVVVAGVGLGVGLGLGLRHDKGPTADFGSVTVH